MFFFKWFSPRRLVWAGADDIKSVQKIDPKNIFQPTFFFDQNVFEFFRRKKLSMKQIWLPIPMRNFPKIPKITLRTACEHLKKVRAQSHCVGFASRPHESSLSCFLKPAELIFSEIPGIITFELLIRFESFDMFWIRTRSNSFESGVYDFVGSD